MSQAVLRDNAGGAVRALVGLLLSVLESEASECQRSSQKPEAHELPPLEGRGQFLCFTV